MKSAKRCAFPGIVPLAACILTVILTVFAFLPGAAGEETVQYIKNEWNFVDGSMDVTNGIPAQAAGRLARIRAMGKLTVATEPYYPPQEFIDETKSGQDRFVGADMELARLIAQRMGVELEIVPMAFSDVLTSVADGKYDLGISGLSFTSGRAAIMEMSKGYYFTPEEASTALIIRPEDAENIRGVADLAARCIVAKSGSLQETTAAENIPDYYKFLRLDGTEDVYNAVITGRADAGAVDLENAKAYIENHPDCALMIVPNVYFALQPQYKGDRVAAPKGEIELLYFVNGVIDEVLASGQYDAWFDEYSHYGASQR